MSLILQFHNIHGKRVYVVDDHHHALIPWALERQTQGIPFTTLTLDHHTDTLPAFRNHTVEQVGEDKEKAELLRQELLARFRSVDEPVIKKAIALLRHDEHLSFAIETGIIKQAVVFPHENESLDVHPDITIIHDPCLPGCDKEDHDRNCLEAYYQGMLDASFLNHNLNQLNKEKGITIPGCPFILDIDLDAFKMAKAVSPRDSSTFYDLIRRSDFITICLESCWVKLLSMEWEPVTADWLLEEILCHIEKAMK